MELLDKSLLRLLKHRDKYDRYISSVPLDLVDKHAKTILLDYGRFFIETEADTATAKEFVPWMMLAHPKLNDTAKATLSSIIQEVQEDSPEGVERGLLRRLEEHKQVARMTNLIERYGAGDEVDVLATVQDMADRMPVLKNASAFVPVDVDGILDEQLNDVGFHWRLQCLNNSMRPLAGGDFLIYAARFPRGRLPTAGGRCQSTGNLQRSMAARCAKPGWLRFACLATGHGIRQCPSKALNRPVVRRTGHGLYNPSLMVLWRVVGRFNEYQALLMCWPVLAGAGAHALPVLGAAHCMLALPGSCPVLACCMLAGATARFTHAAMARFPKGKT